MELALIFYHLPLRQPLQFSQQLLVFSWALYLHFQLKFLFSGFKPKFDYLIFIF